MAPEIMDSSPPGNGKIAVKVMAETVSSIDSTEFKSLRADLAPLFNQNTLAKILSVAEAYLRNNRCFILDVWVLPRKPIQSSRETTKVSCNKHFK
ncbi:uncharacterized protein PFLUO_LOCUS1181 [Penicillium psychrofluorescens]|uniref:uncharacterized protein n=1 Tax=Penicillium psychrofluorescens TaxID=3158075 RepID=UPI003CCD0C01